MKRTAGFFRRTFCPSSSVAYLSEVSSNSKSLSRMTVSGSVLRFIGSDRRVELS